MKKSYKGKYNAAEIIERLQQGESYGDIARSFNVKSSIIRWVVLRNNHLYREKNLTYEQIIQESAEKRKALSQEKNQEHKQAQETEIITFLTEHRTLTTHEVVKATGFPLATVLKLRQNYPHLRYQNKKELILQHLEEIKQKLATGTTKVAIAKAYEVNYQYLHRVLREAEHDQSRR